MEKTDFLISRLSNTKRQGLFKVFSFVLMVCFLTFSTGVFGQGGPASLVSLNSPLPQLKTKADANSAVTNDFATSMVQGKSTLTPGSTEAEFLMKKARLMGAFRQIMAETSSNVPSALYQVFVNNVDFGFQAPLDYKNNAYVSRQWPAEFQYLVDLVKI